MDVLTTARAMQLLREKPKYEEFCSTIIERFCVTPYYALQGNAGQYYPARSNQYDKESDLLTINPVAVMQHLYGSITVGVYTPSKTGKTKWLSFDFDEPRIKKKEISVEEGLAGLQPHVKTVNDRLSALGLNTIWEFSGFKGYHVFCLWDEPVPADEVRLIGTKVVNGLPIPMEVFPKQSTTAHLIKGLGNLIKLPFALHKSSQKRSCLIDGHFQPLENQANALQHIKLNDRFSLARIYSQLISGEQQVPTGQIGNETPAHAPTSILAKLFDLNTIQITPGRRNEMTYIFVNRCFDKGYSTEQAKTAGEQWLANNKDNFSSPMDLAIKELYRDIDLIYSQRKSSSVV